MTSEIHGHEVMSMILAAKRPFTRDSLTAFIQEKFGADARFHTCSAAGLSAADLVEFLAAKGKFAGPESGFTVDPQRVCNH